MNNEHLTTGSYLVGCPALGERQVCHGLAAANDVCYSMWDESDSYSWVEDWLGHTVLEYGAAYQL